MKQHHLLPLLLGIFTCSTLSAQTDALTDANFISPDEESGSSAFNDQPTSSNYWQGATLAYNLDGASADNIVANTKFMINPLDWGKNGKQWIKLNWNLGVVGNFGNFIASRDKDDVDKDIARISQSTQGLNVGFSLLGATGGSSNAIFRVEYIPSYRLNAFQNIGGDSVTVALNQFRNGLTLEGEFHGFTNGGALTISFETAYSTFSKSRYRNIFDTERSGIWTAEETVVLPISENLGMLSNVTFAQGMSPAYQFGIFIRPPRK